MIVALMQSSTNILLVVILHLSCDLICSLWNTLGEKQQLTPLVVRFVVNRQLQMVMSSIRRLEGKKTEKQGAIFESGRAKMVTVNDRSNT